MRNAPVARIFAGAALCAILLAAAPARAERDWFASLYTNEGVELRADERLFTLYALLNAMGYDEAPVVRKYPVPARDMHPVRLQVRNTLQLDAAQIAKASSFLDSHPVPVEQYARYALTVGGPGAFKPTSESPADLKGAETLLADAYSQLKLAELFAKLQAEYRNALKAYLPVVDGPVQAVRKLLKISDDEQTNVVLVVNLLDARGKAYSSKAGDELFVVLGPSNEPDLYSVAREFARARVAPIVQKRAGGVKGLAEASQAARAEGAEESSPAAWATEVIARAFAARALALSDSGIANHSRGGYQPVAEIAKSVDEFSKSTKSLDAFVAEAMVAMTNGRKKGR